jgi:hypothetical protein
MPLTRPIQPRKAVILSEATDSLIVSDEVEGPAFAFGLPLCQLLFQRCLCHFAAVAVAVQD